MGDGGGTGGAGIEIVGLGHDSTHKRNIVMTVIFSFIALVALIPIIAGSICLNNGSCSTLRPHNITIISIGITILFILILVVPFCFCCVPDDDACMHKAITATLAVFATFSGLMILVFGFSMELALFNVSDAKAVGLGIMFGIPAVSILLLLYYAFACFFNCDCCGDNDITGGITIKG